MWCDVGEASHFNFDVQNEHSQYSQPMINYPMPLCVLLRCRLSFLFNSNRVFVDISERGCVMT